MKIRVASRLALVVALLSCAGLATSAWSQTVPTKVKPSKTEPAAPATPAKQPDAQPPAQTGPRGAPKRGTYVERGKSRDTMLKIGVRVMTEIKTKVTTKNIPALPSKPNGETKNPGTPTGPVPEISIDLKEQGIFAIDSISMIFPFARTTAGSDMLGDVVDWPEVAGGPLGYRGRFYVGDKVIDTQPDILTGYPAGVQLAKWVYTRAEGDKEFREVKLDVEMPVRCYEVKFNEKAAMAVPWPRVWPEEASSALKPQTYIERGLTSDGEVKDFDPKPLEATLAGWLNEEGIKDVKSVPLVQVAKVLTGRVWKAVQPSGDGQVSQKRTGKMMGLQIQPPSVTLDRGRGSEHDMVVLLTAMLKQAGIPARTVIGLEAQADGDRFLDDRGGSKGLRAWVEFCVYDEAQNTINWVPIDIFMMRRGAPRPPKMNTEWKLFGTMEKTAELVPFALQYHPPTDVATYGIAGFWGWFVTPKAPADVEMTLSFHATSVPRRASEELKPADMKKRDSEKSDKKKKLGD
jgi:hypothetical protein